MREKEYNNYIDSLFENIQKTYQINKKDINSFKENFYSRFGYDLFAYAAHTKQINKKDFSFKDLLNINTNTTIDFLRTLFLKDEILQNNNNFKILEKILEYDNTTLSDIKNYQNKDLWMALVIQLWSEDEFNIVTKNMFALNSYPSNLADDDGDSILDYAISFAVGGSNSNYFIDLFLDKIEDDDFWRTITLNENNDYAGPNFGRFYQVNKIKTKIKAIQEKEALNQNLDEIKNMKENNNKIFKI